MKPVESETASLPAEGNAAELRVSRAVQEYLAALENGQKLDRSELLARYADIADALTECLDGLEFIHCTAHEVRAQADVVAALEMPAPLGDFRIVRELGRGGMGIVYEAVQLSLSRRVALKVLPFAATLDARQLQRFKNEAQAAAHFHHPNIVPVFGVGCDRGVHFYAMQHIEGDTLAALIAAADRQKAAGNETRPAPTTLRAGLTETITSRSSRERFRAIAQLGVQAAGAMEYAHQLGVVHRDIKPANLILDIRGNLWVTDFGLAMFQNSPGLTITGELLGTLRYMSPEQAWGKMMNVDQRTDIYSLGATLYELLTLQPLFAGQDRQELLRQIAFEEPRSPRTVGPGTPVELETIVLKALAKSPTDRYATAQELADDLQRFLDDKPVRARRPSLAEKAARWGRRHKPVVISAVVVLLLAVAALAAATFLVKAAYDRERQKAQEAEEQRVRAEASFRQARQAVDFFAQLGEKELASAPHLHGLRKRMLEAALVYYQDFIDQHRDDPAIQAELAATRARVTRILGELTALQGSAHFLILNDPAVHEDLGLSPEQREQVKALTSRLSQQWHQALMGKPVGDAQGPSPVVELARNAEQDVLKILTSTQLKRFREIALQVQQRGPQGFQDAEIVKTLRLTANQTEQINKLHEESWQMIRDQFDGRPPSKFTGPDPEMEIRKLEKILALLTPEQRARWKKLTGEPFKGGLHGPIGLPLPPPPFPLPPLLPADESKPPSE